MRSLTHLPVGSKIRREPEIYNNNIFNEQLHSTTVNNMYKDNDDYMASASKHKWQSDGWNNKNYFACHSTLLHKQ